MEILLIVLQFFVGLNILRIWLVTSQRASIYRGGDGEAKTLRQEFEYYGLSIQFMYLVGVLKCAAALGLIVGYWVPAVTPFAAGGLIVLMIGAVVMHIKVNDKVQTYLPALLMLTLSTTILLLAVL
ncbi:MAG: DoxX family protein [Bacteroidota bacterium]